MSHLATNFQMNDIGSIPKRLRINNRKIKPFKKAHTTSVLNFRFSHNVFLS